MLITCTQPFEKCTLYFSKVALIPFCLLNKKLKWSLKFADIVVVVIVVFQRPHLVNLNEDPLMSECLLYYVKDGITRWINSNSNLECIIFNLDKYRLKFFGSASGQDEAIPVF